MDRLMVRACLLFVTLRVALAAETGNLAICPEHPRYFKVGDKHVVLVGASDRDALTIWDNDKGFHWKDYLRVLAAHRINYVRQDVFSWGALTAWKKYPAQFTYPAWPFQRTGPGKAIDGQPKFDLTQFDQTYFDERLKPFLRETRRLGIYVELTLFEGMRASRAFADSLYAPENNGNELGLKPRFVTSDAALEHRALRAIQEAYVDKVLRETAEFDHVIYEIANESGGRAWVAHFIEFIHQHPTHSSRLVSAGEQTSAFDPRTGRNDIVVKHRGGGGRYATSTDVRNHYLALQRFQVGKPVLHNEYFLFANGSTDDVHFPRKMMWADFLAGGHSNFYDFSFWRGTGRTMKEGETSRAPPTQILEGAQFLMEFIHDQKIDYWTMTPRDGVIRTTSREDQDAADPSAMVLTTGNDDQEYLAYLLGEGRVNLAITLPEGSYACHYYNPQTGQFLGPSTHFLGGQERILTTPLFEQDLVLLLRPAK